MKLIIAFILCLFLTNSLQSQVDENGNPVFNSTLISDETIDNFELSSFYYTIDNNISNKKSSVYMTAKPTLADYLKFSRNLPANYFVVHQGQKVRYMIILLQNNDNNKTSLKYMVMNALSGERKEIPCNVFGEINEKRVQELIKLKVDTASEILTLPLGNLFLFNNIAYRIQPYDSLKNEVIELSKQIMMSENDKITNPEEYIKKETIGGKLDFKKLLESEGHGSSLQLFDGIAYNPKQFSILLWGQAVKKLGISSVKDAIKLWENIYNIEMTTPEKDALTKGFEAEID